MLYAPNGALLDRFDYPDDFAPEGASMGVDWSNATPDLNDDLYEWCQQQSPWDWANSSDIGTPNALNDLCF